MGKITLLASQLVDGTGGAPLPDAFLKIENGAITAVGKQSDLGSTAAEAIDLGNATLLPGLINMHTHLTLSASRTVLHDALNDSFEMKMMRAISQARAAIESGVTTIRDCGTRNEIVFAIREATRTGMIPGPHVWASGDVLTSTGGHCYFFGVECDSHDEAVKAVRSQVKAGADFIKVMATGGRLTPNSMPLYPQFTRDQLVAIREDSTRLGRYVAAHCLGTPGVENAIVAHVRTIEHCAYMRPGGMQHDPELASAIAEKGIYVCPTVGAGERSRREADQNGTMSDFDRLQRELRLESINKMRDIGVKLISGNDAGVGMTKFDDFQLDLEVMVEKVGMSPIESIHTATGLAAEAIGSDEFGVLAEGKRADVLAVSGDAADDIYALRNVMMVMKSGDIVVNKMTQVA